MAKDDYHFEAEATQEQQDALRWIATEVEAKPLLAQVGDIFEDAPQAMVRAVAFLQEFGEGGLQALMSWPTVRQKFIESGAYRVVEFDPEVEAANMDDERVMALQKQLNDLDRQPLLMKQASNETLQQKEQIRHNIMGLRLGKWVLRKAA